MDNTKLSTHEKGDRGEDQAVEYLLSKGYTIICRKYRSLKGEIDCVVRDTEGMLVFVEVKSSYGGLFGNPLYWITPGKQRTLSRMATQYIVEHNLSGIPCRFDVITIHDGKIDHLRNAFLLK